MTRFAVRHETVYRYRRPVRFDEHRLLFRPRDSFDQRLIAANVSAEPGPSRLRWIHDVFGNCVALVALPEPAETLRFETVIRLDHDPQAGPDFCLDADARTYPFAYDAEEGPDLAALVRPQFPEEADVVGFWAKRFLKQGRVTETASLLMTLCRGIQDSFAYARRTAPGTQSPATTLSLRRGTCRDFALLMMEAARALGFAARFVTGYIYVPSRDTPFQDRARGANRGGGSTHAWCQIYLPGAGWVEFDPTNGIVGNRDLIRVAVAREPAQAVPLSGSFRGRADDFLGMDVSVEVWTEPEQAAHTPRREPAAYQPQGENAFDPRSNPAANPAATPAQEAAMMGRGFQQG